MWDKAIQFPHLFLFIMVKPLWQGTGGKKHIITYMKKEITSEELELIESCYDEEFLEVYKTLIDCVNSKQFELLRPYNRWEINDIDLEFFQSDYGYWQSDLNRSACYWNGLKQDFDIPKETDPLNFSIRIKTYSLKGDTLIDFYRFAEKYSFDIKILNDWDSLIIHFCKVSKTRRDFFYINIHPYSFAYFPSKRQIPTHSYHFKNPSIVFENLIENINWDYYALIILFYYEKCCDEYSELSYSVDLKALYDKVRGYFIPHSNIFEFLSPAISIEHQYCFSEDIPDWISDEDYIFEHASVNKMIDFCSSYLENTEQIRSDWYKESYKSLLSQPLPFQTIDYKLLSKKEKEDRYVYIYRLSAFLDSYLLYRILKIYQRMKSYSLKMSFFILPIENKREKRKYKKLLDTTRNLNPYLYALFNNIPLDDQYIDDEVKMSSYDYDEEYINFFFYITEYKEKKGCDLETFVKDLKEEEERRRREEWEYQMSEDYRIENERFLQSMNEDFPGWGWNFN